MPIAMTPANFARLGNQILGQHYGWGGMLGLRDCSAMTRDLMTPFGIWLPRGNGITPTNVTNATKKDFCVQRMYDKSLAANSQNRILWIVLTILQTHSRASYSLLSMPFYHTRRESQG